MSGDGAPPLDAAGIARRQFATARKGFDANEVRRYLDQLAERVADLQRREAEQRARAEAAEARATPIEQMDEHRLVALLGSETARVLESAREAASDIRTKAEEAAARLISEANDEAHRLRAEAEAAVATQRLEMLAELEGLQREAADELERRRAEGAELAAEMRREAERECEALRAEAEDEGRQMVEEAQVVRERMLRDLARRRRAAREQVERLNAARERLLAAHEVVRRTVDEATTELTVALPEAKLAGEAAMRRVSGEPEPTVEELDEMVAMARIAGLVDVSPPPAPEAPPEPALQPGPDPVPEPVPVPVTVTGVDARDPEPASPADDEPATLDEPESGAGEDEPVADGDPVVEDELIADDDRVAGEVAEVAAEDERAEDERAEESDEPDVDEWGDDEDWDEPVGEPVPAAAGSSVDQLFARLKAETADAPTTGDVVEINGNGLEVDPLDLEHETYGAAAIHRREQAVAVLADEPVPDAEPQVDADAEPEVDAEPAAAADADDDPESIHHVDQTPAATQLLVRRDQILASVESDVARRLKMVLADEQNEVLDALRRGKVPDGIDDLLPAHGPHAGRYTDAAREDLAMVAELGAEAVGGEPDGTGESLAAELAQTVVEPLRERIGRCIDGADDDLGELTGRLRALYREWKTQRITDAVRHFTAAAYAHGAYAAAPKGSSLCWLVDRSGTPCPDADDNALAGAVRKGESFPTGDHCPPAHLGCRCLVVPVAQVEARVNQPQAHQ